MTKTDVAREYANKHKDMPSLNLARLLVAKEPSMFHSVEQARFAIRSVRGSAGRKSRKNSEIVVPTLPPSYEHQWLPFNLMPRNGDVIALFSDIHIPYHNLKALECAIAEAIRCNANIVLLNGDTLDCHELSKYEKDPRDRKFREEVVAIRQLLEYLRSKFKKTRIIWKDGNHDERLYLYLRRHAPALLGIDVFEQSSVLKFDNYGIEYVTGKRPIVCGKLNILHGHEYIGGISAPVNPARGLFLRAKACCIEGHFHQTSEHSEPTLEGKNIACWSTGCLCELHPQYMPLNKWNHGFAMIEVGCEGNFRIRNRKIINGEIW